MKLLKVIREVNKAKVVIFKGYVFKATFNFNKFHLQEHMFCCIINKWQSKLFFIIY